jgi:hypothetical protein
LSTTWLFGLASQVAFTLGDAASRRASEKASRHASKAQKTRARRRQPIQRVGESRPVLLSKALASKLESSG